MRALLVVDIQYDFMPGGALAVREGDEVVPVANHLMCEFDLVIASQDWHPRNHASFAENHPGCSPGDVVELEGGDQVLWPAHCVQGTRGAELHEDLDRGRITHTIRKGTDPRIDSYSAFFDNMHHRDTGLTVLLESLGVRSLTVCGLATDYCVKFTALDARALGLEVEVDAAGCRAVDLSAGDGARAFREMSDAGCRIISTV